MWQEIVIAYADDTNLNDTYNALTMVATSSPSSSPHPVFNGKPVGGGTDWGFEAYSSTDVQASRDDCTSTITAEARYLFASAHGSVQSFHSSGKLSEDVSFTLRAWKNFDWQERTNEDEQAFLAEAEAAFNTDKRNFIQNHGTHYVSAIKKGHIVNVGVSGSFNSIADACGCSIAIGAAARGSSVGGSFDSTISKASQYLREGTEFSVSATGKGRAIDAVDMPMQGESPSAWQQKLESHFGKCQLDGVPTDQLPFNLKIRFTKFPFITVLDVFDGVDIERLYQQYATIDQQLAFARQAVAEEQYKPENQVYPYIISSDYALLKKYIGLAESALKEILDYVNSKGVGPVPTVIEPEFPKPKIQPSKTTFQTSYNTLRDAIICKISGGHFAKLRMSHNAIYQEPWKSSLNPILYEGFPASSNFPPEMWFVVDQTSYDQEGLITVRIALTNNFHVPDMMMIKTAVVSLELFDTNDRVVASSAVDY